MDDDAEAIENCGMTVDELCSLMFEQDMNILNLAIDKESERILEYLCEVLKTRPNIKNCLVNNTFGKNNLQAVH